MIMLVIKTWTAFILVLAAVIVSQLLYCTDIEPEKIWDNPFDSQGVNYFPPLVSPRSDTTVAINKKVSITVSATDQSGSIATYNWSTDGGITWDSGGNLYSRTWRSDDAGVHVLWYRAIDNDGLVSVPDSFRVDVHRYAPMVIPVRDSSVSQMANVTITFNASDTNGFIEKYYWKDLQHVDGWTDSLENNRVHFSNNKGGPLSIVWAAKDDEGLLTVDTFVLIFNRAPVSTTIHDIVSKFISFDYDTYKGKLPLTFSAVDPDGTSDVLQYRLQLSTSDSSQVLGYEGNDTVYQDGQLFPDTRYTWRLRVTDRLGDSFESSGSFMTPGPPLAPDAMRFIRSKGHTFTMGQGGFADYELPLHPVTFTHHFWMDSTEVTDGSYNRVLKIKDTIIANDSYPVANVNWFDAVLYCNARSKSEQRDTVYRYTGVSGKPGQHCTLTNVSIDMSSPGYHLPTEAEWEYACRASSETLFYWGNSPVSLTDNAWVKSTSDAKLHQPAQKKSNTFALYDMAGNVWEWCNDWFEERYYYASPMENPSGPQSGAQKVMRGGSYLHGDYFTQSGSRNRLQPQTSDVSVGFRTVLVIK